MRPIPVQLLAEVKPLDILGWILEAAVAVAGIAIVLGLIAMLVQPFFALLTRSEVMEESLALWFWIAVLAVIAGLLYWQFS